MRIIFAGTPYFAAVILQGLLDGPHDIIAAYTQPDKQAGRGQQSQASEVKELAQRYHLPIHQPISLKDKSAQQVLADLKPDLMVVAAYGMLLPASVLAIPRLGCLNVHASLLPHWRGAAPIARAIEAGDKETGISMMQMVEALDAGPVWETFSLAINSEDTHGSLTDKLALLAAEHINDTIDRVEEGKSQPIPQNHSQSSYAKKLTKAEGLVDWSLPAEVLERQVRAFNPWPVSYTYIKDHSLRIWEAEALPLSSSEKPGTLVNLSAKGLEISTGKGMLRLIEVQLSGKARIQAGELYKTKHPLFQSGINFSSHEI
jgi:methionyl-tRNA formyltransferase